MSKMRNVHSKAWWGWQETGNGIRKDIEVKQNEKGIGQGIDAREWSALTSVWVGWGGGDGMHLV
jgi:hypothetical protein